jgi:phosphoribosylformylglycinamidine cyclo-ligase
MTYAGLGVSRSKREVSRKSVAKTLKAQTVDYSHGRPLELPFGFVFPSPRNPSTLIDLQIEGVGTKTLLAEIAHKYDGIGIDAVAMAVNDVLRSGARPVLVSDAIHISESRESVVRDLVSGVTRGAEMSGCVLASGETGDVREILHAPLSTESLPFDMMVSCLGLAEKEDLILGEIGEGDEVIGLESSGIHSNGITLARRLLLRPWGGAFDPWDKPEPLRRPLIEELLEPTRIFSETIRDLQPRVKIKAAIHVTGDGFGKFRRLLEWTRIRRLGKFGVRFHGLGRAPAIFRLIFDTSRERHTPISAKEMFETFNMGYGFAVVLRKNEVDLALDRLNKHCSAKRIGEVTRSGLISIENNLSGNKLLILKP